MGQLNYSPTNGLYRTENRDHDLYSKCNIIGNFVCCNQLRIGTLGRVSLDSTMVHTSYAYNIKQ